MDDLREIGPLSRFIPLKTSEGNKQSVGYFQGTFEQMQTLGLIDETEVACMVGSLVAQQKLLNPCRTIHDNPNYIPDFDLLGVDTYTLVTANVTNAEIVSLGGALLEKEVVTTLTEQDLSTDHVPLLNQMVPNMDPWPRDIIFKWNNTAFQMLGQSATVLDAASLLILRKLRTLPSLVMPKVQEGNKDRLTITDSVVATINNHREAIAATDISPRTLAMHEGTYCKWQEVSRKLADLLPIITPITTDAVAKARQRETDEKMGALTAELAEQVTAHTEQTSAFRPHWSMLERKAGLRPFYNKLLHVSRSETNPLAIATAQDAKRLTGILHTLERLGSKPEQLPAHMKRLIANEHTATEDIQRIAGEITALGGNHKTDWRPVGDDIHFLQAHWPTIIDIVRDHWKPGAKFTTTAQSIEAMHRALAAYRHEAEIIGTER